MEFLVGELPVKGLRAWTQDGLKKHGYTKVDVPPETGGTIIFEYDEGTMYAVKWDTGSVTVHSVYAFAKELICIGSHYTLYEYWMQEQAEEKDDHN